MFRFMLFFALLFISQACACFDSLPCYAEQRPPNILFAISDDQSYPYASAYGTSGVNTPAFDRVAREGVLFTNAFVPSPGCSPTRAAILTGRYPWQNQHAGTHASSFSNQLTVYPTLFEQAGYHVGYTGKGWGPGNYRDGGFTRNPAGQEYTKRLEQVPPGIRGTDYAGAFAAFLQERQSDQPFCFWYGSSEPHRKFGAGIGLAHGKQLADAKVPSFLPDVPEVRQDILDYCFEIEWSDQHLARMINLLEEAGELENTLIVVTSDNGMAFPRAKANAFEYGVHVPLAIRWGNRVPGGRVVDDLVNLVDIMPTFLAAAKLKHPGQRPMSGKSLLPILESKADGKVQADRSVTYAGRERHSSSRWQNLSYPQRCIRSDEYLYIRNFRPERWPAGAPQKMGVGNYPQDRSKVGPMHAAYHDIDGSPTLDFLIASAHHAEFGKYLGWAVDVRPAEELYQIKNDPGCLQNLADDNRHQAIKQNLSEKLEQFLHETHDPRIVDGGDVFESYRRYSRIRDFPRPAWAEE